MVRQKYPHKPPTNHPQTTQHTTHKPPTSHPQNRPPPPFSPALPPAVERAARRRFVRSLAPHADISLRNSHLHPAGIILQVGVATLLVMHRAVIRV